MVEANRTLQQAPAISDAQATDPTEPREIAKRYVSDVQERIELFDDILCAVERSADAPRGRLPTPKRRDRDDDVGFPSAFDGYVVAVTEANIGRAEIFSPPQTGAVQHAVRLAI